MTTTCPPCERPVHDGYLCHACTETLRATLRAAPEWADQLGLVLARLTRYTAPGGRRGADKPLPYNPAATGPAARLDGVLRAAAAACGAPGVVRTGRLGVVAAWLAANTDHLRTMPTAPEWEASISKSVERAIAVCDRPPEQWYAGACGTCGTDLYPTRGDKTVTCGCGNAWSVEDKRAELLAKARAVDAPGPVIARALSTLGTRPVTPELLRKWRHRGLLEVRHMSTDPPTNWYRVGDVLDLLANEGKRRARR